MRGGNWLHCPLDPANEFVRLEGLVQAPDGIRLPTLITGKQALGGGGDLAPIAGLASLGIDAQGNIYIADAAANRIIRIDGCSGQRCALPCLRGPGSGPGELREPGGLAVDPIRNRLYISDTGNHRIQVLDLATEQVIAIWSAGEVWGRGEASTLPGAFTAPGDLAVDDEGSVYVVEPELGRLQKLSPDGCSDEEFLATIAAAPLHHPTQVAILKTGNRTRLLVIEQSSRRARVSKLRVYHSDGRLDEPLTDTLWRTRSMFTAIAAGDTGFFAVDLLAGGPTQQILQFDENGQLLGIIDRVDERVAGLALDCKGRLILQSADGSTLSFEGDERFAATGRLLAGPFRIQDFKTQWNRLNLVADVPSGTQLQLETWVTDTELEISEVASSSEASAPLEPEWEAAPPGARDLRVGAEGQFLWIRCELGSNGQATPCLEHLAIRYEMQPWIDRLPAIYKHEETGADLLRRILDLCQSVEEEFRDDVTAMAHEFSPVTAGADGAPSSWLDWLAGWLDLVLDEHWDESLRREITSRAFDLFSRRGTRAGLAELLELFVGVPVTIREPAAAAALWSLGRAPLGCGTMLVPASEQGAILDTTALLDQSHLIDQGDFGAPLFDDIAHCFCVEVRADDIPDEATLLRLKHLVELEKPAHTLAHVCVLEDKFSLGLQNRLGIDTIVGGPPAHGPLGDGRSTSALVLEDSIPNEALTGDAVVGPDTSLG